jgi:hypothetical protein
MVEIRSAVTPAFTRKFLAAVARLSPKAEVVFLASAIVALAFDGEFNALVLFQEVPHHP